MTQPTLACESVESVASYPKTSTEELNQSGCHKRCPRGVAEASQGGVEPAGAGAKQGKLQLAGASFRDLYKYQTAAYRIPTFAAGFRS